MSLTRPACMTCSRTYSFVSATHLICSWSENHCTMFFSKIQKNILSFFVLFKTTDWIVFDTFQKFFWEYNAALLSQFIFSTYDRIWIWSNKSSQLVWVHRSFFADVGVWKMWHFWAPGATKCLSYTSILIRIGVLITKT